MQTSDTINLIAAALAKAQGELQNVVKDAKNPHFKSDYATLDAITDTVRPVFAKHGLAVVQIPTFAEGIVGVETLVMHTSGEWIKGVTSAPIPKADPQGVGSATTYLRRYSLAAIAALAQTDDDGEAATRGKAEQKAAPLPAGFGEWWADMQATADNGTPDLEAAWKASKPEYRQYITAHQKQAWETLKAKAAKVKAHAAA